MTLTIRVARHRRELQAHVPPPKAPAGELSDPIDPDLLSPDLRTRREVAYSLVFSKRFDEWLAKWIAWNGWPRDEIEPAATLLSCYVWEVLLASALHPELFPRPAGEDEDEEGGEDYGAPATEVDAAYHGLRVVRAPRKRQRVAATLPGCWGLAADGSPCLSLRVRGHKFCPACERAERQRIRAAQGG